MNLYWVETDDHHEDWFVIAGSPSEAARWFESYEGYDSGDAGATLVQEIPPHINVRCDWAQLPLLEALGGVVKSDADSGRVVELNGVTYCEGLLEGEILRADAYREQLWQGDLAAPKDHKLQ